MLLDDALADARARLLHDLSATSQTTPDVVNVLDDVLAERRLWAQPWPEGVVFITCLAAQDLQEALEESLGRWPACRSDGAHQLHIEPDLGAHPQWVCADCATAVAPVGEL